MRFLCLMIALALLAALPSYSLGQSQEPPRQDAKSPEQQSDAKDSATNQSAIIVKEPSTQQTDKKAESSATKGIHKWLDGWSLSDKIAVIASIVAFLQFLALIATVSVMRRTAQRQLRAYVSNPISTEISRFDTATPLIRLGFKNSGQTPAHDMRIWTNSAVAVFPLESPPISPDDMPGAGTSSKGVIGPGVDFHIAVQSDIPVTDDERNRVIAGDAAFYVYGNLFYVDAFGGRRKTTFCVLYHGESARRPSGILATYDKWNEAT